MWQVLFDDDFAREFLEFDQAVRDAIVAYAGALEREGPQLKRPYADSVHGSRHSNMKEL